MKNIILLMRRMNLLMLINTKVIGFIGIEQFDIILYLSRVLKNLNKKILLFDLSENFKLSACIPFPDQLLAIDNSDCKVIDYSGVDIIMKGEGSKKISSFIKQEYDYILIDFGFDLKNKEIIKCNELFLVTDFNKTNISKLNNYLFDSIKNKFLIFRDVVDGKITPIYVLEEHLPNLRIEKNQCSTLYQDYLDTKMKISWQYDDNIRFKKLSIHFKNWIKDTVAYLSNSTKKEIEKAYKAAERGE